MLSWKLNVHSSAHVFFVLVKIFYHNCACDREAIMACIEIFVYPVTTKMSHVCICSDGYAMTHIASRSMEKIPYYFSRSSVKVTWAEKLINWFGSHLRLQGRSQLSNPPDLPCSVWEQYQSSHTYNDLNINLITFDLYMILVCSIP